MPSSKPEERADALAFDPEAVLLSDAGMLLDKHFLNALHAELCRARDAERARIALMQIGCLHGLRDAERAFGTAFSAPSAWAAGPAAPALAVQLRGQPDTRPRGALELSGCWPERAEALARLGYDHPVDGPICAVSAGYTSGWLSGILETDLVVVETHCTAAGDAACTFVAREIEIWREGDDACGRALAEALPVGSLRLALAAAAPPTTPEPADESPDPVVHIWGPVMLVPFDGADEALMAVDLLHSDPTVAEVSVIVVDFTDRVAGEGCGAASLERIVETVERAGADTVFAGVSPLLEPLVASLEPPPTLVCQDLGTAIAASFQIVESQRRPV